jgi:hypothetical protein
MRDLLLARVRPLVERFAADLTELVIARIDADLERVGEALAVAASTFASEVTSADSDRPDHDPVPEVPRGTGRGLHGDGARGARPGRDVDRKPPPPPAQAPTLGRGEGQRPARLVEHGPDLPDDALGPQLAGMLKPQPTAPPPAIVDRDTKPENITRERVPGKVTCSKCGHVGGNARGCGKSHPTRFTSPGQASEMYGAGSEQAAAIEHQATRAPTHAVFTVEPPRTRGDGGAYNRAAATARQPSKPAERPVSAPSPAALRLAEMRRTNNPNAEERWSTDRIMAESLDAEDRKHDGELPQPSSSYEVEHRHGGAGLAHVRQVAGREPELESELDFGGAGR